MIEPPTMIIPDVEEERTLVDPRHAIPRPCHQMRTAHKSAKRRTKPASQLLSSLVSGHGAQIAGIGLALCVLVGLGSVAFQQWKVATVLRQTIAEMKHSAQAAVVPGSVYAIRSWEEPHREVDRRAVIAAPLEPEEREAREGRAATSIAANDFPAALSQYQALAELLPHVDAFQHLVYVLRAKLGCDRAGREPCP